MDAPEPYLIHCGRLLVGNNCRAEKVKLEKSRPINRPLEAKELRS